MTPEDEAVLLAFKDAAIALAPLPRRDKLRVLNALLILLIKDELEVATKPVSKDEEERS